MFCVIHFAFMKNKQTDISILFETTLLKESEANDILPLSKGGPAKQVGDVANEQFFFDVFCGNLGRN